MPPITATTTDGDDNNKDDNYFDPTTITASLPLLPFDNQVGGHASFFRFSKRTICKAVSTREREFYECMAQKSTALLPFLPQYFGTVNVTYTHDGVPHIMFDKNKQLLRDWRAYCLGNNNSSSNSSPPRQQQQQIHPPKRRHSVSSARKAILQEIFSPKALAERLRLVEKSTEAGFRPQSLPEPSSLGRQQEILHGEHHGPCEQQHQQDTIFPCSPVMRIDQENKHWETRELPTNPWSLRVYERDQQKRNKEQDSTYIMIEDLTDGITYPCVLDLKMGRRQHGVYATPGKMASQIRKCQASTSGTLGVRVCGMQVYRQGHFYFQDKYHGRRLTAETFRETIAEFLDNGEGVQVHHIPVILRKLKRLIAVIEDLKNYRFYGSSLLMIYDGSDPDRPMDVRIIDFAHSVTADEFASAYASFTYPPSHMDCPDDGYLLGIKSLHACFQSIWHDTTTTTHNNNNNDGDDDDDLIFDWQQ